MTPPTGPSRTDEPRLGVIDSLLFHGRYATARAHLRALVAAEPDRPGPWCLLAQACLGCGDDEGALDAATRAAGLAPADEWAHRLRSAALERLGRHAQAADAAQSATWCEPGNWATHARRADALTAQPDPDRPRTERALEAAAEAVRLGPDEPGAYRVLAQVHGRLGDRDEARAADIRALQLAGRDAAAQHDLGVTRLRLGRLAAAGTAFAYAASLDRRGPAQPGFDLVCRALLARPLRRAALALGLLGMLAGIAGDAPALRLWAAAAVVALAHVLLAPLAGLARAAGRGRRRAVLGALRRGRGWPAQVGLLGLALAAAVAVLALPAGVLPAVAGAGVLALAGAAGLSWYGEEDVVVHPVPPRR